MEPESWKNTNTVLGKLDNLKHLDLSSVWNMQDSEGLKSLENLESIQIGRNYDLKNLFSTLQYLPKLRILECNQNYNSETQIPADICNCKSLELLMLYGNYGFHTFPENIGDLKKMKHIDIRSCSFSRTERDRVYEVLPHCDIVWKD